MKSFIVFAGCFTIGLVVSMVCTGQTGISSVVSAAIIVVCLPVGYGIGLGIRRLLRY